MDLDTLTTAGTLAVALTITFLGITRLWQLLTALVSATPVFADSRMREAAERLRNEVERLTRNQSSYLAAIVVYGLIFLAALSLDVSGLYQGYPDWQLKLIVLALSGAALWILYKVGLTLITLSKARFERDACIAVGHQLQRLTASHGAVFHDVEVGEGLIDNVLIGPGGAYAVHVIAVRGKTGDATLDDETLTLGGREPIRLDGYTNRVHRLGALFSKTAGNPVRVRSVIAVPGWEVREQHSDKHLLVNERTLPMLTGWREQSDYLMDDDVRAIRLLLTEAGKR